MAKTYIDVDEAIKALCRKWFQGFSKAVDIIKEVPAADVVERKRGTWIEVGYWSEGVGMGESYGNYFKCSVCEKRVRGGYGHCYMNYCPNCGAKMNK